MKKLFILILTVLITVSSFGQFSKVGSELGNSNTLIPIPGATISKFINESFEDTTAANLTPIKDYPGSIIFTLTPDALWKRNSTAVKWVRFVLIGEDTLLILDPLYIVDSSNGKAYLGVHLQNLNTTLTTGYSSTQQTILLSNSFAEFRAEHPSNGAAAILRVYEGLVNSGMLLLVNTGNHVGRIAASNLTKNNLLELPDTSGIVAMRIKIGDTYYNSEVNGVIDLGNKLVARNIIHTTSSQSSAFTAVEGNGYILENSTLSSIVITLPASPEDGDIIEFLNTGTGNPLGSDWEFNTTVHSSRFAGGFTILATTESIILRYYGGSINQWWKINN